MARLRGKGQTLARAHVGEVYSPVRATCLADKMGLFLGLALDLTTSDERGTERGTPWEFSAEATRAKAKTKSRPRLQSSQ